VPATVHEHESGAKLTNAGIVVLTRGPVHEAFAQPVNLGRGLALVVTQRPPEVITEVPPELKPVTGNVAWIPGYWGWDGERNDFIWVSGVWRVPPPGMQWIAGYWADANGGYRWAPGFWTDANTQDVQYCPTPPVSAEKGSTAEPPSAGDFWTPGYWSWRDQDSQFVWNAGYWAQAKPGWVWIPSSFSWTPRGYVFSNGYWDYALDNRGLLFAPLAVRTSLENAGYVYTPSVAIDPALLSFYLFVRPAYGHYYFGDYYADEYIGLGIYPWYDVNRFPDYNYDPLLAYDRWYFGTSDPDWTHNLERWNTYYRQHPLARPPHDLAAEQSMTAQIRGRPDREYLMIGRPLGTVWQNSIFPVRLARLSIADRGKIMETVRSTRGFQAQRSRMEAVTGGRSMDQSAAGLKGLATASNGPQKAMLPRYVQTIALRVPNRLDVPTTPATGYSQRQSQASPLVGAAIRPESSPGTQSPTRQEVWKPITLSGENVGRRPGWNSEPPPATVPEPSLQTTRGPKEETELFSPPRRAGRSPNPQLRPMLPPGAEQRADSSMKIGLAPRHPRSPSIQPPAAAGVKPASDERNLAPPRGTASKGEDEPKKP
jgi:hypothetical protein